MSGSTLPRESEEYLEILSSVFAELVRKATVATENHATNEVTPSLAQCMEYVYLHGPSPVGRIAAGLSISVPAVSQLVDRLFQKNLVTREHNAEDRRLARIDLTEKGKSWVVESRARRMQWLRDILRKMPANRQAALVDSLEEFIRTALGSAGHVDEACVRCGIDHLAFCVVGKAHIDATGEPIEQF